jgi:hypothetical protein
VWEAACPFIGQVALLLPGLLFAIKPNVWVFFLKIGELYAKIIFLKVPQ